MKIMTILGSPRKKGNTATVLSCFEQLIPATHLIERINITDYEIKGCLGCDACHKALNEPGCIQKDDANTLLKRLLTADVIIYATPLYVWSFSAQLKTLFDRHYCLVKWRDGQVARALLAHKRTALLVTCGAAVENNADVIQVIFEREMRYLQGRVIGKYIVPNCTLPDQLGEKGERTAQELFNDIFKED